VAVSFPDRAEVVGLGRRASGVEKASAELLKKKLSRIAKARRAGPAARPGQVRGLFTCSFS